MEHFTQRDGTWIYTGSERPIVALKLAKIAGLKAVEIAGRLWEQNHKGQWY